LVIDFTLNWQDRETTHQSIIHLANDDSQLLDNVYNRITEGIDTPDLKEARSLLNGLS
jgi:hypothetical protein